jgi:putative transposase
MTQLRKHYSPAFKAQVVQEVLADEKSLGQIAAQHGIHPNIISKWKRAALQSMSAAFAGEQQAQSR